jgi:thymidylate synthase ThyX
MATQPLPQFEAPESVGVEAAIPRVTLRNAFAHPYDSAIAAARTCYAPRLIAPEEVNDKQRLMIGAATFYGGHHTVWQHAHFEFGLENVSRQFVWSFLHAHPFYNSEQQSQRYVRLDRAVAFVPAGGPGFGAAERAIYERAIARAWAYYRELTALLLPDAREILGDIWHVGKLSHPRRVKKVEGQADKRAIEVARYVLPVAAATTMVHTLSGIVLQIRRRNRAQSWAKWSRARASLIRNFSTASITSRSSRCRNGSNLRMPPRMAVLRMAKHLPRNLTRSSAGVSQSSWIGRRAPRALSRNLIAP